MHSGVGCRYLSAAYGLERDDTSPIGRAETIGRNDEEPGIYIAGKAYLGGGGTMPGYGVQFPILLLSAHRRGHLKAHFYSEQGRWSAERACLWRDQRVILSSFIKTENIVKTREVTDYREMQTSQLEDLLYDYQNRMCTETDEDEREWLTEQLGEVQSILDERSEDESE